MLMANFENDPTQMQFVCVSGLQYLRMATVRASGDEAQGQMTSGFRPLDWNTLRKASHDDTDPDGGSGPRVSGNTPHNTDILGNTVLSNTHSVK